jgi:hypothetical protein
MALKNIGASVRARLLRMAQERKPFSQARHGIDVPLQDVQPKPSGTGILDRPQSILGHAEPLRHVPQAQPACFSRLRAAARKGQEPCDLLQSRSREEGVVPEAPAQKGEGCV